MTSTSSLRWAAALVLAVSLAACAGPQRTVTPESLRAAREEQQTVYVTQRDALARRLADRIVGGDRTLDILILSGGGQHGAFGAGFLRGWSERADDPMPTFDVVTGISTGALQAPLAFEGTPEALRRLADLYREPERIAPDLDLFGALFGRAGGVFDTRALDATLAEVFDERQVARLQTGFADGRQLFIGTTDLDLGRGRVWNVGREVAPTAAGATRLQRLLRASSAIPGAFAPVVIDGHVHTDGGITTNLLGADLAMFQRLAAELRARGETRPVEIRVWAIVNLYLAPPVKVVDPGSVRSVSERATGLLFALGQQQALMRLWETAQAVNASRDGLTVQFRYTALPDSFAAETGAQELFDETYMHRIQDYGFARARGAEPWSALPPGPFE